MAVDADKEPTSDDVSGAEPSGHGRLARRVTIWSGNLLVTGVLLILGLAFGRQVLQWWRQPPPSVTAPHDQAFADFVPMAHRGIAQLLEFGDLPITLGRVVFEGDQHASLAELRRRCREIAARSSSLARAAEPTEMRLLRRLAKSEPVEQGPGWKIFQESGPVLMVVVVRSIPAPAQDKAAGAGSANAESVVSWGLGLRHVASTAGKGTTPNRWTLFTCSAKGRPAESGLKLPLPLPPGSRRTLSVRVERGGALIGFVGRASVQAWTRFFDRSFEQRGWARSGTWLRMGTSWHARYHRPESGACDVQLAGKASGLLRGILTVAPAAQRSEK